MKIFSSQSGDTIIEVLISITILASVLISVFIVINRDLAIELDAHEQTTALNIIQSQLEQLRLDIQKSNFDKNFTNHRSLHPQYFCLLNNQFKLNQTCYFNSNLNDQLSPSNNYPYAVRIYYGSAKTSTGQISSNGYNFKFQVRWGVAGGLQSLTNQETLHYRLYLG